MLESCKEFSSCGLLMHQISENCTPAVIASCNFPALPFITLDSRSGYGLYLYCQQMGGTATISIIPRTNNICFPQRRVTVAYISVCLILTPTLRFRLTTTNQQTTLVTLQAYLSLQKPSNITEVYTKKKKKIYIYKFSVCRLVYPNNLCHS